MHLENAAVLYIYTWLGPLYKMMTVYTLKIKLSLCVLYIFTSTLDLFSLLAMTTFHLFFSGADGTTDGCVVAGWSWCRDPGESFDKRFLNGPHGNNISLIYTSP